MSKFIMIRPAGNGLYGPYKTATWTGPINSKARHYIRKLMTEYFESMYRAWPFVDHIDLVATCFDDKGNVMPICLTYGGIIADDKWQMYAGGYWGVPRMARWTRELSRDEMKMYLNSKYGQASERLRLRAAALRDANYNVRHYLYFDTDTVRGDEPD